MGNKASEESIYYDNSYLIDINIGGLRQVDKLSYLTVFGFVRKYWEFQNNQTLIIPVDIINTCLLYYYDKNDVQTFTKSFDINYYLTNAWEISNDKQTIKGIYNKFGWFPVYFLCEYNLDGYTAGIHYFALKYISGDQDNACCAIGVTGNHTKDVTNKLFYEWPGFGNFSFWNGYKEKPYWNKLSTIMIKLDLNNFIIYYYKKENKKTKLQLIKKEKLKENKKYYFMICACAHNEFYQQFDIVPCHMILK